MKHTLEYIKSIIEKEGYILQSDIYNGNRENLKILCPNGHNIEMRYDNFQQGKRCIICSGNKKHTLEEIRKIIENDGNVLLSSNYTNNKQKLSIRCPNGHIFSMVLHDFQRGYRCPTCAGVKKHTLNEISVLLKNEGYTLLSNSYKNAHTKIRLQCPKGHEFTILWNSFQQGQRCSICSFMNGQSKPEKYIVEYVKTIYDGVIIENDRTIIRNPLTNRMLELDAYLPDVNKAIEFNGSYWHSNNYAKEKDMIKKIQCKEKNIELLVIEEKDWITNKNICLNNITSFILS